MASFPNAVKAFTTKNAGDTIQPTHVNDLQDEVNAIEAGYLNGTANLNSSNSTLANLSVSGGSTLSSHVTIGGNLTVTGTMTVGGGSPLAAAACLLTHSVKQDIPSAAWTGLNWDTITADASGMHSTSVNSSRITFTPSTGLYLVGVTLEWTLPSTGKSVELRLVTNDTIGVAGAYFPNITINNNAPQQVTSLIRAASTSDYVTCQALFSAGSTASVFGSTLFGLNFWAAKVL
jgi:hypothetical protein